MRIPTFGWLAGLMRKPKRVNLDGAMLRCASVMEEKDSFCIKEELWRHSDRVCPHRFQVTLFRGMNPAIQLEGYDLDKTVDLALDEYRVLRETSLAQ